MKCYYTNYQVHAYASVPWEIRASILDQTKMRASFGVFGWRRYV